MAASKPAKARPLYEPGRSVSTERRVAARASYYAGTLSDRPIADLRLAVRMAVARRFGGFVRALPFVLLSSLASTAIANTSPDSAPVPTWVKRVPFDVPTQTTAAPVRILLMDQQVKLERETSSQFTETAALIQTAEGLSAGNIAMTWRPDVENLSVHSLALIRHGKRIDVLASQKFTVIRREPQLEAAMLDGRLTATLLIDGVEVGDVIDLATTIVRRDPVMAGHAEASVGQWNAMPIDQAHVIIRWPRDLPLQLRSLGDVALPPPVVSTGEKSVEVSLRAIEPLIAPKGAPIRFSLGRLIEATDFRNWADLGAMFEPLFKKAAAIDPTGALSREIDAIRSAHHTPQARAAAALKLVQDRIRYVALSMGAGGYVPAAADATWSSRLGDCKAKTALLLAMLDRLDIPAIPVAVSSAGLDVVGSQLPMVGLFDHVLVRATIGGRDYWLDGTRTGDFDLSRIETPNFRWGLPLVRANARLVAMTPPPRTDPDSAMTLTVDARGGVFAKAKAHGEMLLRGDSALVTKIAFSALSAAQREQALREYWKRQYDFIEATRVSESFDETIGAQKLTVDGDAKLEWNDTWFRVPGSGLAFAADFSRPAGINSDAPFSVAFPNFSTGDTQILLPKGIELWPGKIGHDVDETLAGVHYRRSASLTDGLFQMRVSARAMVPEVDAATAREAQARLRALNDEDVQLQMGNYDATDTDLTALAALKPNSFSDFMRRGAFRLKRQRATDALADFNAALAFEPKNARALAGRGAARLATGDSKGAEADFAAAETISPGSPIVARGRSLIAANQGHGESLFAALSEAIAKNPTDSASLGARASAYYQFGRTELALADTETMLRLGPDLIAPTRLLRANIFVRTGRNDRALAEADALTRAAHPTNTDFVTAAKIYHRLGETAKATAAFQSALAVKPEAFVYINRATIRDHADVAGIAADVDAALRLEPDNVDALLIRARVAVDRKDYRTAIAAYDTALQTDTSEKAIILNNRAIAHLRSGDASAAQHDFTDAEANANGASDLNNLCYDKATSGVALDLALKECERALEIAPSSGNILDSRGFVHLRRSELDAAIADYDAALAKNPGMGSSLYGRAVAWWRKGDKGKAMADFAAARKSDPNVEREFSGYGVPWPGPSQPDARASAH